LSKFNTPTARPVAGRGPVAAQPTPFGRTHEGGPGYAHDAKSELFLLAVANFVGENTFYEKAGDRDRRYADLVQAVAATDPAGRLLRWLRTDANMRSASLVGALEAAKAMLAADIPGARQIVDSVLQRADEPGEALAYWTATTAGRCPSRSSAASLTPSPACTPSGPCSSTTPASHASGVAVAARCPRCRPFLVGVRWLDRPPGGVMRRRRAPIGVFGGGVAGR